MQSIEYAPNGLFGVLTPQANTTVEPELSILAPPGTAIVTARLVSELPLMDDRLVEYSATMETVLDRFANAPLRAAAFACTGASYLVALTDEQERVEAVRKARGYPLITAANAIDLAIAALAAKRIALISPYGDSLHQKAIDYWRSRSMPIASVRRIQSDDRAFHPIYALKASAAEQAVKEAKGEDVDAIVLLGTGLATLPAILRFGSAERPVVSPNLCLMWQLVAGGKSDFDSLRPWLDGQAWKDRFQARLAS